MFDNKYQHLCQAYADIDLILKKALPSIYEKKYINNSYYDNIMYEKFQYDQLNQDQIIISKEKKIDDNTICPK